MRKSLTNLLIGAGLYAGSTGFYSCQEKPKIEQIKKTQTSSEDTLLKSAGNYYYKGNYNLAKENYSKYLKLRCCGSESIR